MSDELSSGNSPVVAAHTDIMASVVDRFRVGGENAVFDRRHAKILREGGVNIFCDHLGGDSRYGYSPASGLYSDPLRRAMRMFDHAYRESAESESLSLVTSAREIREALNSGKIAMILGMEGGSPLQGELSYLRMFYRLGLRSLGLTHNWRNALADGCLERSQGGLTHFGRSVVRECNELGIVIDVSHMAPGGVRDALSATSAPVIASHTNPRAVRDHPHNLPDALLRAIADTGGFIGVFVLNTYVSKKPAPRLSDITRMIDYLIDVVGVDHVGIAPDIMENWDQDGFKAITEGSATFEAIPTKPIDYSYPAEIDSLAKLGNLRTAMKVDIGLSDLELDKILGGNCLRVYEEVWGG